MAPGHPARWQKTDITAMPARRLSWLAVSATGRIGEVWHLAARNRPGQRVIVDRAPDVDPVGALERPCPVTGRRVLEVKEFGTGALAELTDRVACVDGTPAGREDVLDFGRLRHEPVPPRRLRAYTARG